MKDKQANWFPGLAVNVGCGLVMLSIAVGISIFFIRVCAQ